MNRAKPPPGRLSKTSRTEVGSNVSTCYLYQILYLAQRIWEPFNVKCSSLGNLTLQRNCNSAIWSLRSIPNCRVRLSNNLRHGVSITVSRIRHWTPFVVSFQRMTSLTSMKGTFKGLKNEGVTAVKRIVMWREGEEINTKHLSLTFELYAHSFLTHSGVFAANVLVMDLEPTAAGKLGQGVHMPHLGCLCYAPCHL